MERIAAEPEVRACAELMTEETSPKPRKALLSAMARSGILIHREGMSFKKSDAAGRARSPRRGAPPGAAGKNIRTRIDPARLVFIDETWVKTNMAPIRGWCARGRRLAAKIPRTVTGRQ